MIRELGGVTIRDQIAREQTNQRASGYQISGRKGIISELAPKKLGILETDRETNQGGWSWQPPIPPSIKANMANHGFITVCHVYYY
jgi:hypothetical protein